MDLRRFLQLLPRNAALLRRISFHETAIDRQVLALHQSHFHTLAHDLFKQLLEHRPVNAVRQYRFCCFWLYSRQPGCYSAYRFGKPLDMNCTVTLSPMGSDCASSVRSITASRTSRSILSD